LICLKGDGWKKLEDLEVNGFLNLSELSTYLTYAKNIYLRHTLMKYKQPFVSVE